MNKLDLQYSKSYPVVLYLHSTEMYCALGGVYLHVNTPVCPKYRSPVPGTCEITSTKAEVEKVSFNFLGIFIKYYLW